LAGRWFTMQLPIKSINAGSAVQNRHKWKAGEQAADFRGD